MDGVGDEKRKESPRSSGGWMENGNEQAWRIRNIAGVKGQSQTVTNPETGEKR